MLISLNGLAGHRPLDQAASRWLLAEIVERRLSGKRLEHYGQLDQVDALVDLLAAEIDSLVARGASAKKLLARARQSGVRRQLELAEVYSDYANACDSAGLLDRESRWRRAAELLGNPPGEQLRWTFVAAAGFDSLSCNEERFLVEVFKRAERVEFALPAEPPLAPNDTEHEKPAIVRVAEQAGPVRTLASDASEDAGQDLAFLRSWLFHDPNETPAPPEGIPGRTASGVRIVTGSSVQDEAESLAREIKQLLLSGVDPSSIVVTTPALRRAAPRLAAACRSCGVPIAVEAVLTLGEAAVMQQLLALLALPERDWRHADVLSVLTSPGLRRFDEPPESLGDDAWRLIRRAGLAGPRAAAELAVRRLLLPSGRNELADQLQRQIAYLERIDAERADADRGREQELLACRCAAGLVEQLSAAFDALPEQATPLAWFDGLRALLDRLAYAAAGADATETAETDLAALDVLEDAFSSLERLARWRGKPLPRLSLKEVARLVGDWAPRLSLPPSRSQEGCVRLLPFDAARAARPRHLFVMGLVEGTLPRALPRADPFMDSTPAIRESHTRHEMERFHRVVGAATESVTLSFATLDDSAQPLNPSSFVSEVQRLFLPRSLVVEPTDAPNPMSPAEVRLNAVRALRDGQAGLKGLVADPVTAPNAPAVLDGVEVTLQRSTGDAFGDAEGVLSGPAARKEFTERYGPDHLWSPSQLELYAECPFKFFMRHGLSVTPLDPLSLDIDYRRRGSLLHDAMVRFHQSLANGHSQGLSETEFHSRFEDAVQAAVESVGASPHERPLARVEAKQAIAWGPLYRDQLADYAAAGGLDEPMQPAYFEARFGPSRSGEVTDDVLSTDEPFRLPLGEESLLLTGRIDRIDVASVGGRLVFNVVDYKTAASVKSTVEGARSGRQLQLFLYALAAERLLLRDQEAAPWRIGYWEVQGKGFKPPKENRRELKASEVEAGVIETTEAWRDLETEVADRLKGVVAGIRQAEFPMLNEDEDCAGRCEFAGVCRVAQARGVGKLAPHAEAPNDGETVRATAPEETAP